MDCLKKSLKLKEPKDFTKVSLSLYGELSSIEEYISVCSIPPKDSVNFKKILKLD